MPVTFWAGQSHGGMVGYIIRLDAVVGVVIGQDSTTVFVSNGGPFVLPWQTARDFNEAFDKYRKGE